MRWMIPLLVMSVAGCDMARNVFSRDEPASEPVVQGQSGTAPRPETRPPLTAGAQTAEALDRTTAAEQAAAAAPATGGGGLGQTVTSLGNPAEPGFWLKTPLVQQEQSGRVEYNGNSAQVTLIPLDGPATGGSRMSLPAMRLIGAPLTDLVEVAVFSAG